MAKNMLLKNGKRIKNDDQATFKVAFLFAFYSVLSPDLHTYHFRNMQTILRSEVYRLINSGEPFDMVFVTCNKKKGTGGELVSCQGWIVLHAKKVEGEGLKAKGEENSQFSILNSQFQKDPHHVENGTVNVFNPANSGYHPVKVHYDLIQIFNEKRVIN